MLKSHYCKNIYRDFINLNEWILLTKNVVEKRMKTKNIWDILLSATNTEYVSKNLIPFQ